MTLLRQLLVWSPVRLHLWHQSLELLPFDLLLVGALVPVFKEGVLEEGAKELELELVLPNLN